MSPTRSGYRAAVSCRGAAAPVHLCRPGGASEPGGPQTAGEPGSPAEDVPRLDPVQVPPTAGGRTDGGRDQLTGDVGEMWVEPLWSVCGLV